MDAQILDTSGGKTITKSSKFMYLPYLKHTDLTFSGFLTKSSIQNACHFFNLSDEFIVTGSYFS